jgi:hypothetical protein
MIAQAPLPHRCAVVKPDGGVAVIICEPAAEGFLAKLAPTVPSLGMSLVALAVSALSLYYTLSKDQRARKQSIQDDFWLRKVVSPVSIEPLVKFGTELLANLPGEDSDPAAANTFGTDKLSELRGLTEAFRTLLLIKDSLFAEVEPLLESVEDRLAEYMGQLDAHWRSGTPAPSRPEAMADLSARLMAVLGPIKSHQAGVGFAN